METVRARSCADIPVVTPSRASIEIVKAVSCLEEFCVLIRLKPNWAIRSDVKARQIKPRPCIAIKLIASGVAI